MEKTEETRKNIIETTVKLAQEKGVPNVTVKDICDTLGISKGTFYVYFHNIDEPLGKTYDYHETRKIQQLPEILLKYDDPLDQFWELAKLDIERHISFGPNVLGEITLHNVNENSLQVEGDLPPTFKAYITLIKKMQDADEIGNKSDPYILFRILISTVFGIDIRWSHNPDAFDYKEECYNLCKGLLLPKKKPSNY